MPRRPSVRAAALAAVGAVALLGALLAGTAPASAINGNGLGATTFYAYVAAGEQLHIDMTTRSSVTATRPDGTAAFACTAVSNAITPCQFDETATSDGVWMVSHTYTVDQNLAWRIEVRDAGSAPIPGRVWTERLGLTNTSLAVRNFSAGYVSEWGVRYQAQFTGHYGWGFNVLATNRGVMHNDGTCRSAYRSVPMQNEAANGGIPAVIASDFTIDGGCDAQGLTRYRIFFNELPDPALPESAAAWADGRTTNTWILPDYRDPVISGTAFARAATGPGGTITGTLSGQPGTLRVLIDVDGDGAFDGTVDRSFEVAVGLGDFTIPWDGLDGEGNPVPRTQSVDMKVELTGEAEIHFIETDVEGRTGGIRITRLNGPGAPDARVSWDDSHLPAPRATVTPVLIGDRVDTSTGVVHNWGVNGNGWGNTRIIEDWAFIYPSAFSLLAVDGETVPVVEPEEPGTQPVALPATGWDGSALGGALAAALAGLLLVAQRRRSARRTA